MSSRNRSPRRRTKVNAANRGDVPLDENGMEEVENFFDSARSPPTVAAKASPKAASATKKKMPSALKRNPRFSMDGQQSPAGSGHKTVSKMLSKLTAKRSKAYGSMSPSELSTVSTLPAEPESPGASEAESSKEDVEDTEEVMAAGFEADNDNPLSPIANADSDEEIENLTPQTQEDEEVPPRPDDDDADDAPPTDNEEIAMATPMKDDDEENVPRPMNDDYDDDDDDKEGPGYQLPDDDSEEEEVEPNPETPESIKIARQIELEEAEKAKSKKKRGRPKKKKTQSSDNDVVTVTPVNKGQKRKSKKQTKFAPFASKGIQSGPLEFDAVPVTDLKASPDPDGLRRSKRSKIEPIQFWKNERPVYSAHQEDGILGDAMGSMPEVTHYNRARPTPYKKRKAPPTLLSKKAAPATKRFDPRQMKSKSKQRIMRGTKAMIYDNETNDIVSLDCVAHLNRDSLHELPRMKRPRGASKIYCSSAQTFTSEATNEASGCIMGHLQIPPGGVKDQETTTDATMLFIVSTCQPGALEFAIADPKETVFVPKNAQRFFLDPSSHARVLPENVYRIENHSETTEAILSWVILRS